ncbi:MAG: hypothetical protein M1823_006556, partial [Watsoniomyces obsoletus]
MGGIASPAVDPNIDKWITLLCNSIPLYSDAVFFTNLLKLTECFCKRVQSYFGGLQSMFEAKETAGELSVAGTMTDVGNPERSITNLLSGLEYVLARAHTKVTEAARPTSSNQEPANEISKPRALAN